MANQIDFSVVLFDTLFGLILFFSIDSLLDIKEPLKFIFYVFTMIVLIHWWLIFKSADDCFGEEVTQSAADLTFGIIYLILIDYVVVLSKTFDYSKATLFLITLFFVDLIWAFIWLYVGEWKTKDKNNIKAMERELSNNIKIDSIIIVLFLALILLSTALSPLQFVISFIIMYSLYIIMTFYYKIIDIRIF
jgi:hypothetical protein